LKTGAPGDYECKMEDLGTGTDTPTGTLDTWLAMTSGRAWVLTDTGVGGGSMTFFGKIHLRHATTLEEYGDKAVNLEVRK